MKKSGKNEGGGAAKKFRRNGGLQKFPNIYQKTAKNNAKIKKLSFIFFGGGLRKFSHF